MTGFQAKKHLLADKINVILVSTPYPYELPTLRRNKAADTSSPWYVEYKVWSETSEKLKRKRVVLNQATKKARLLESEIIIDEILELLKSGAIVDPLPKKVSAIQVNDQTSLKQAITNYLALKKDNTADITWRQYRTHLQRKLWKYAEQQGFLDTPLEKITIAKANLFMDSLTDLGNRTKNNVRDNCGLLFSFYMKRSDTLKTNPFLEVQTLTTESKKYKAYLQLEADAVIKELERVGDDQLDFFIKTIYYTATRPNSETRFLQVKHITDETLFVPSNLAKNSKGQHIQLVEPLAQVIKERGIRNYPPDYYIFGIDGIPAAKPVGIKFFYRKYVKILKSISLSDHDLYGWKHTGVIRLWQEYQDIELIRRHCRHGNVIMTTTYLRDLGLFTDYSKLKKFPPISSINQ